MELKQVFKKTFKQDFLGNFLGAFSDTPILLPMIALLSVVPDFSVQKVCLVFGLVYLSASYFFRVPISVQPLKSVAISAVTLGASFNEIKICGLILGLVFFAGSFLKLDKLAEKIPVSIIHSIQAGLGALLILQGFKSFEFPFEHYVFIQSILITVIVAATIYFPAFGKVSLLGVLATLGVVMSLFAESTARSHVAQISQKLLQSQIRYDLVFSMLIPQMILTTANSVIGTCDVAKRYFKKDAARVSIQNLMISIGLGNVLVALVGGLPFCHGSGGVTAHYRGGSRSWYSTAFMGVFLISFAVVSNVTGYTQVLFHPLMVSLLLIVIGYFHLKLAAPTYFWSSGRIKIILSVLTALFTQNLIWVLLFSILLEWIEKRFFIKSRQINL